MLKTNLPQTASKETSAYYSIYQSLSIPICIWHKIGGDFELLDANQAAVSFFKGFHSLTPKVKACSFFKETPEILSDFNECFGISEKMERDFQTVLWGSKGLRFFLLTYIPLEGDLVIWQAEEITTRKTSEYAITKHRNLLASFIDESPAALAIFDKELRYLGVSKKWISDYKLEGTELLGKSHYEIFPEINQDWKDVHQRCLAGAIEAREEDVFLRADGSVEWLRWEIRPWHEPSEEIGGIVMFCEFVTDKKKAKDALLANKEALRKTTRKLETILQNLPVGVSMESVDGHTAFFNNTLIEMTGYDLTEVGDVKGWLRQVCPESENRSRLEKEWTESRNKARDSKNKPLPLQLTARCKDGKIKYIEVYTSVIGDEYITVYQDISDFVRKEAQLQVLNDQMRLQNEELNKAKKRIEKNEARLIEAQKAARVGNWETDLTDYSVNWSQEIYDIFELDSQTFFPTHESFLTYVHPEDRLRVDEAFVTSFGSNEYHSIEHRIKTANGDVKCVEERWRVSFDKEGKPRRVFGTCQDISDRKRIEEELIRTKEKAVEHEERLKLAIEAAHLGIWDWNILGDELVWDDRTCEIYGIENKSDMDYFEFWVKSLHPGDKERVLEELNLALRGNYLYQSEFRIIKPNGEIAHVQAHAFLTYEEDGTPARMIGMARDITATTEYEEKIKQSEEHNRSLIENISDGILLVDENYLIKYQSPSVEKIVGWTIEDRYNKSIKDYIHPDDSGYCVRLYEMAGNSPGIPIQGQIRTAHKSGKYIWIEATVTNLMHLGSVRGFVVTCRDITERKEFEEQLALSSLIVNSSHDAIMSISVNSIITSWNQGAVKMFGYQPEEIVGTPIYKLIAKEFHAEEEMIWERIKKHQLVDHYETLRLHKDGTPIQVSLTVSPIIDELGNVIGASKIMRDIREQKANEREKAKIMNDLIQKNRDLEQFAYIVSHNLRAPVTNIMGINHLLHSEEVTSEEKEELFKALGKSVGNLDMVIKDLNHILQVRREINEHKVPVRFSALVEEIKLSVSSMIEKEKVRIITNFSEVEEMMTIRSYIYSIFYNLITNSIKYRRPEEAPIIEITSSLTKNKLELVFRDNGLGFDLDAKGDQIFGLYKRFHLHVEGKGMGLYMVKAQVEALGGKISLQSELNRGTEFRIEFEL